MRCTWCSATAVVDTGAWVTPRSCGRPACIALSMGVELSYEGWRARVRRDEIPASHRHAIKLLAGADARRETMERERGEVDMTGWLLW